MKDLLSSFTDYIDSERLFNKKDMLLLAVSGGIDSVVLCELCRQAGFEFVIAHCNFQLRGEESKRDEAFVKNLGHKYSAEVLVKQFETEEYAALNKVSIQVAARELRYQWFNDIIISGSGKQHPAFILTAHHADDNIETVLMNFFKGTGIAGLRGILPQSGKIIRPLLFARKEELTAFADVHKLSFVEDSSNISDKYSRNYFRHQVIPMVQKIFPEAAGNIAAGIGRFREMEILYEQSIAIHKKKLLEYRNEEVYIPVLKLLQSIPLKTIVYEIIKDYGFTSKQSDEVISLLKSDTGRYVLSATHRILKNRKWLIITSLQNQESKILVIEKDDEEIFFSEGKLMLTIQELTDKGVVVPAETKDSVAMIDMDSIKFPLMLRKWKEGDYFYPLGMCKKKKLSRFFIDKKMSLSEKERIWILESDKKIIWVVNKRIDDRFKLSQSTKKMLKINLERT